MPTFPQPNSALPVQNSQEFFRIYTPISSGENVIAANGMYESEVSCKSLILGPNSDIARVRVTYPDANSPTGQSQAIITPDRGLNGLLTARPDTKYPLSGRTGVILFEVKDLYWPAWRPDNYSPGVDTIIFETPFLDVIQYFNDAPSLVTQRSDRTFDFQYVAAVGGMGGHAYIVIPAYGRKSGFFNFKNMDGTTTIPTSVVGVKLSISQYLVEGSYQKQLFTDALTGDGDSAEFVYKSSEHGLWDYLVIALENYAGNAMPMVAQLSDDAL